MDSLLGRLVLQRYRDTVLRYGGERRPREMLSRLLGDDGGETRGLAEGLCEDVAAGEDAARALLGQARNPSWCLVK